MRCFSLRKRKPWTSWLCKWGEKHISSIITRWYTKQKLSLLWPHTFHRTMKTLYSEASPRKAEQSRTRCHGAMAFTSWLLKDFSDSLFRCWIYDTEVWSSSSPWPRRVQSHGSLTVSNGIQYLEYFFFAVWKIMQTWIAAAFSRVMYHCLNINPVMACEGNNGNASTFQKSLSSDCDLFLFFSPHRM